MLEELKTFIAVVEYENFTKAGESINLSQPSVSVHIKNLEEYFNAKLITRSIKQKSISITEDGYLLYKRAKEILKLIDNTKDQLKNISKTVKGHLKVGASFTIGEYFLPTFLAQFSKEYPEVEFEVIIENTANICEKIKSMKLDIGLIEGVAPSVEFNQKYFLEDRMVIMTSFNHDLTKQKFSYDNLQKQNWIARERGSGTREYLDMFLTTKEITPKSMMVLGSNCAIKEAVKNNLGITLISNYVTEDGVKNDELSVVELDGEYKRHFSYILPRDIMKSRATEVFIENLISYSEKKKSK